MNKDEKKVYTTLQDLQKKWFTIEIISEASNLPIIRTKNALVKLTEKGLVEASEWDDGVRIKLICKEKPLTEEQKLLVENNLHLINTFIQRKLPPFLKEELRSDLIFKLIYCAKNYRKEGDFSLYAKTCLLKAKIGWWKKLKDIKEKDQSEDYNIEFNHTYKNTENLKEEINHILSGLEQSEAEVILLSEYYGLTVQETADILKTSTRKISSLKKSGIEKILSGKTGQEKESILPKILIGYSTPWPSKSVKITICPICKNKKIKNCYCLRCDGSGIDPIWKNIKIKEDKRCKKLITRLKKDKRNAKTNVSSRLDG